MRTAVSRVRARFSMISVVEVGRRTGPPEPLAGALIVQVESSEEFPAVWDRLVSR
jgi:hypothetical protein